MAARAWISGTEAWKLIKATLVNVDDVDLRLALRDAVRNCVVECRRIGLDAREQARARYGLLGDVEGDWLRMFMRADPEESNWAAYLARGEFQRSSVVRWMTSMHRATRTQRGSPPSRKQIQTFAVAFCQSELAANRKPTQSRFEKNAGSELPNAQRGQLRAVFAEVAQKFGIPLKRGRASKSPT
jgi:hypothetical protein